MLYGLIRILVNAAWRFRVWIRVCVNAITSTKSVAFAIIGIALTGAGLTQSIKLGAEANSLAKEANRLSATANNLTRAGNEVALKALNLQICQGRPVSDFV